MIETQSVSVSRQGLRDKLGASRAHLTVETKPKSSKSYVPFLSLRHCLGLCRQTRSAADKRP